MTVLPAQKPEQLQAAREGVDAWLQLAARDREEARLKKLVTQVHEAGKPLIQYLAGRLRASRQKSDQNSYRAAVSLASHLGLRWLKRIEDEGMVYVGQFDPLLPLMPELGGFYLELLLDTPEWFSITRRHEVVPVLRDLYPKGPGAEVVERIEAIALDVEIEPQYLREQLTLALAQWGHRKLVKDRIRKLRQRAGKGDAEDALLALRDLAALQYGIRDYTVAAVHFVDFLDRAERVKHHREPNDYYNAVCCLALTGNLHGGMKLLQRCLAYNKSDAFDSSLKLKRSLFEKDPEIAVLRRDARFNRMLDSCFGKPADKGAADRETKPAKRGGGAPRGGRER